VKCYSEEISTQTKNVKWEKLSTQLEIQGDSNMTWTNCDLFTHKLSRSYLNHLVTRANVLLISLESGCITFSYFCSSVTQPCFSKPTVDGSR
jgi:hypothetical protein